jgi:hypothetical protein
MKHSDCQLEPDIRRSVSTAEFDSPPSPPQTQTIINSRPTSREFFVLEEDYTRGLTGGRNFENRPEWCLWLIETRVEIAEAFGRDIVFF